MSTELCGLELRQKACEAVGYRCSKVDQFNGIDTAWLRPGGGIHNPFTSIMMRVVRDLPAIESDSAVAWLIFLEWCKAEHWLWQLEETVAGDYALHLRAKASKPTPHWNSFDVTGSNPCECIARAIVKATEVKA